MTVQTFSNTKPPTLLQNNNYSIEFCDFPRGGRLFSFSWGYAGGAPAGIPTAQFNQTGTERSPIGITSGNVSGGAGIYLFIGYSYILAYRNLVTWSGTPYVMVPRGFMRLQFIIWTPGDFGSFTQGGLSGPAIAFLTAEVFRD